MPLLRLVFCWFVTPLLVGGGILWLYVWVVIHHTGKAVRLQ